MTLHVKSLMKSVVTYSSGELARRVSSGTQVRNARFRKHG